MIELKNLGKVFPDSTVALENINLTVEDEEIFGIIGLSGAGKSTLVRCVNLLESPTSGDIIIDGTSLLSLNKKELLIARKKIAMIFQNFNLLEQRNVLDNVMLPMLVNKVSRKAALAKAKELIALVGLSSREKHYPSMLSGGEKQRVAIARALGTNPKYLLCDEITSALDPTNTQLILEILKNINREKKVTILLITHEMKVIEQICDRVAIINRSHIEEMGRVMDIFNNPQTDIAKRLILPIANEDAFNSLNEEKIRIIFDEKNTMEAILSNLIIECHAPLNIYYADSKKIDDKVYGQMVVSLPKDDETKEKVRNWLIEHNINYQKEDANV